MEILVILREDLCSQSSSIVSTWLLSENNGTLENPLRWTVVLFIIIHTPVLEIGSDIMPCFALSRKWTPVLVSLSNRNFRVSSLFPYPSIPSERFVMFQRAHAYCLVPGPRGKTMQKPLTTDTFYGWEINLCSWRFHQLHILYLYRYICFLIHILKLDNWKKPTFNYIYNVINKNNAAMKNCPW